MSEDAALESAWRQQRAWSAVADRLKSDLQLSRRLLLVALVASAVLAAGSSWFDGAAELVLGVAAAVILIVVPIVRRRRLSRHAIAEWTRARSASEAMKHEIYTYLVGALQFRIPDPAAELTQRVAGIVGGVSDLSDDAVMSGVAPTPAPVVAGPAEYLEERVASQIETYYRPKARAMRDRTERLNQIETALLVIAGILVLLVLVLDLREALAAVGIVTTVGGAVLAHLEGERYEYLAVSYRATAAHLAQLLDGWRPRAEADTMTGAQIDEMVQACEAAISVENQAWMAAFALSDEIE